MRAMLPFFEVSVTILSVLFVNFGNSGVHVCIQLYGCVIYIFIYELRLNRYTINVLFTLPIRVPTCPVSFQYQLSAR